MKKEFERRGVGKTERFPGTVILPKGGFLLILVRELRGVYQEGGKVGSSRRGRIHSCGGGGGNPARDSKKKKTQPLGKEKEGSNLTSLREKGKKTKNHRAIIQKEGGILISPDHNIQSEKKGGGGRGRNVRAERRGGAEDYYD